MRISLGLFIILLLLSCSQEVSWKVSDRYPDGAVKVEMGFTIKGSDTLFVHQKVFYKEGLLQLEGPLKEGKRNGKWISYYPDGSIWSETHFMEGISQGESKSYYKNGKLRYEGNYVNGEKAGNWNLYDTTGTLVKSADLDNK